MSKRELNKYLKSLTKKQLEDQIEDLYKRFKDVKVYFDFVFNPKEDKLLEECKFKISKEYFPLKGRKPKARRSVAQKYVRRFIQLGVDPYIIAEIMLYNIEIAQTYSKERIIKQESFFISILKSYNEAVKFIEENSLGLDFNFRLEKIAEEAWKQDWFNKLAFENLQKKST